MQEYVKRLIAFRLAHPHFCRRRAYTLMDSIGCHYPDLSVLSDEAWKAKLENYNHSMGLLYCGKYNAQQEDVYVACNMYWQEYSLALPKLSDGRKWYLILDTTAASSDMKKTAIQENIVTCEARSMKILIGCDDEALETL